MNEDLNQNNTLSQIKNGEENPYYEEKNIYPYLRKSILVICVLIAVGVLIFLIYQNGKSIYVNGL